MNKYSTLSALRLQVSACAAALSHRTNAETNDASVKAASQVWWKYADSSSRILPKLLAKGKADDRLDILPPGLHIVAGPKYTGKSFIFSDIASAVSAANGSVIPVSIGEPTSVKYPSVNSIAELISAMCNEAGIPDVTQDATMKAESDTPSQNPVINVSLINLAKKDKTDASDIATTPEYDAWNALLKSTYADQPGVYVGTPRVFLVDSLSSFMTSKDATAGGYFPGGEPTKLVDSLIELSTAFTAMNWIVIAAMNFHDFRGFTPDFPGSIGSSIDLTSPVPDSLTEGNDIESFIAQHAILRHVRIPVYRPDDPVYKVREVRYDDGSNANQSSAKPKSASGTNPVSAFTTLVHEMDNVPRL